MDRDARVADAVELLKSLPDEVLWVLLGLLFTVD
jgi:hypothetical protein